MTATAKLLLAAAGTLLLSVAAAGQDARFTKKGAQPAVQKQDSARCWSLAQKTRLTEEEATQNMVTAYLIGGVVGVLIASSANEDANTNPKSTFKRQVHEGCMTKRGYTKAE
jgi:hypothetical protein